MHLASPQITAEESRAIAPRRTVRVVRATCGAVARFRLVFLNFELYNDDETWLPHSGCTPVALPCFLVTHKTRPAAINIARAM